LQPDGRVDSRSSPGIGAGAALIEDPERYQFDTPANARHADAVVPHGRYRACDVRTMPSLVYRVFGRSPIRIDTGEINPKVGGDIALQVDVVGVHPRIDDGDEYRRHLNRAPGRRGTDHFHAVQLPEIRVVRTANRRARFRRFDGRSGPRLILGPDTLKLDLR